MQQYKKLMQKLYKVNGRESVEEPVTDVAQTPCSDEVPAGKG